MQAMKVVRIATIVEGHGECEAVPVLVRRIALEVDPGFVPIALPPIRIPASRLVKEGELERAVKLAVLKVQGLGGIAVIIDCDDGCPAQEGPKLLSRAKQVSGDMPVSVILAKREYEAWFLAAASSLRCKRQLSSELCPPEHVESIRDAKGWLSDRMPQGCRYSETSDQAALTACFDMSAARRANSFDKCYREVHAMLTRLFIRATEDV